MGKLFLIILIGLKSSCFSLAVAQQQEHIELPVPPSLHFVPPSTSPEAFEQDLETLKNHRKKREKPATSPWQQQLEKQQKHLSVEASKDHPYRFMAQVSWLFPFIFTRPPRSQYTSGLSSHFSMIFRMLPSKAPSQVQPWWGLRLAPFSGSGTYKNTSGRYGFLYLGPMLGLGKIDRAAYPVEERTNGRAAVLAKPGEEEQGLEFPRRYAWLLTAGIALQSRWGETESTDEFVDKDLNTIRWLELDGTGLWAEFTYGVVHFGTLGTHVVAGAQFGEGKIFTWIGMAAGAWY